jgi:hypothetical protein
MSVSGVHLRFDPREIRQSFPAGAVGDALAASAVSEARRSGSDHAGFRERLRLASMYATHAYDSNAGVRHGDLAEWFGLPELPFDELARRGHALQASWWAAQPDPDDEALQDRIERERWAADDADERIARIEERGGYGRTLRHFPACDEYLFIRLGGIPRSGGYSVFGLAGDDTEEGPDPWRAAMSGKVRESGTSVFRARRHPDEPGAYVLIAPDFSNAVYDVPSEHAYFLSIVPGRRFPVLRIDGSPVTTVRHGDRRIVLGSDGEYLVDPCEPWTVHELPLESIWVDLDTTLADFVERHVAEHEHTEDETGGMASPAPRF